MPHAHVAGIKDPAHAALPRSGDRTAVQAQRLFPQLVRRDQKQLVCAGEGGSQARQIRKVSPPDCNAALREVGRFGGIANAGRNIACREPRQQRVHYSPAELTGGSGYDDHPRLPFR